VKPVSDLIPAILAIDPGGTTGVAWLTMDSEDGKHVFGSSEVDGGFDGFVNGFHDQLLNAFLVVALVVEDFIINTGTVKKTQQTDPWAIIGYLRGWALRTNTMMALQTPATAKGFGTDTKLKHLGWHRPSKGGHANDAARHLLVYTRGLPQVRAQLLEFAQDV